MLRTGKTIRGIPEESTYLGRYVAVSPIFSENGKVIAAIGIVLENVTQRGHTVKDFISGSNLSRMMTSRK